MAGRVPPSDIADLLALIKGFVRSLVVDISEGRLPRVSIGRYRTYCFDVSGTCCCSLDLPYGKEVLSLGKESSVRRLDMMLKVLSIIQQLLQENKHGTKRDIYYMHSHVFLEQSVVDQALNDICSIFSCTYHQLHVVPVGKGLVMGWLRFIESDKEVECISQPCTAFPVPVQDKIEGIVSIAQYILVVEKEAVFNRLANDKFCRINRCIVITGRGYPDIATRRFLRILYEKLSLPIFCLVDCDPYGFEILITYRFGSRKMAFDSKLSIPSIQWIGVLPSEVDMYHIPDRCRVPLTPKDKCKAQSMLKRCYLHRDAQSWRLYPTLFRHHFSPATVVGLINYPRA